MRVLWAVMAFVVLSGVTAEILLRTVRHKIHQYDVMYGERLPNAITGFHSAVGYTGLIHNFKNYVLRPRESGYRIAAVRSYDKALYNLGELEALAELAGVEIDTNPIRSTLRSYIDALNVVDERRDDGAAPAEIDAVVRISDASAAVSIIAIVQALRVKSQQETRRQVDELGAILRVLAFLNILGPLIIIWIGWSTLQSDRAQNKLLVGLNEDLTRRNAQLDRTNRELSEFAFFTSHDLRTPMRGIANHARFLVEDFEDKLPAEGRKRLVRMQELCGSMENLVESLLAYADATARNAPEWNDLTEIVTDLADNLPDGVQGEVILETSLPKLFFDPLQLRTCLRHLIVNGLVFNEEAQKTVWVGFADSVFVDGETLHSALYVRDNGIGMEGEFSEDIFRLFKRLQRPGKYGEGIGAGLAFVKKIVEANDGVVRVTSTPHTGSSFYISFPDKESRLRWIKPQKP
ncbi:sensor histidine kinase [Aliishimia ponticola]|nr:ATP-binding protein [Aliishimia ponticola]